MSELSESVLEHRQFGAGCTGCDWFAKDPRLSLKVEHQAHAAEVLDRLLAEAWDEGHRFTGYEPEPGENPYRARVSEGVRS